MIKQVKHIVLNIVTIVLVTMFFSCNDGLKQVQKMGISENEPVGIADSINLKYTDSGRVTANLLSPKRLDFSNRNFPYDEFPKGITLYLYDDENKKSTVVSDYAIVYSATNLIDLQGHVVITTSDNSVLKAEQLYYDQKNEWLFTNKPVTFTTSKDVINGNGFDSNSKFTNAEVLEVTGLINVED